MMENLELTEQQKDLAIAVNTVVEQGGMQDAFVVFLFLILANLQSVAKTDPHASVVTAREFCNRLLALANHNATVADVAGRA